MVCGLRLPGRVQGAISGETAGPVESGLPLGRHPCEPRHIMSCHMRKKYRSFTFSRSEVGLCLPVTSLTLNLDGSEELLRAARIVITVNYG